MGAAQKGLSETFAFDPAHNIVDVSSNTTTKTAQTAPPVRSTPSAQGCSGFIKNNRLEVFEDKRYRYDTHGNLVEKRIGKHTIITLEWDAEHQLRKSTVTRGFNKDDAHEPNPAKRLTQVTHYAYDAFGRRVSKRDKFGETHFVWDGNRLLSETRGSRTLTYLYEPDSFAPLAQLEHQHNKLPLPAGEGWGESGGETETADKSTISGPQGQQVDQAAVEAANKLIEQAEANPRQAAANFQAMMLAKMRAIKGNVALAQTKHAAAANDPSRTIPMQAIPGDTLKRAMAGDERANASVQANANAGTDNEARTGTDRGERPRTYRVQYFHNDHLGTPRELSSEAGEIRWAATYKAWGNTLTVEYPELDAVNDAKSAPQVRTVPAAQISRTISLKKKAAQAETKGNGQGVESDAAQDDEQAHQPIRFQGQYFDSETGLHYNRFRYYDPDCGRFINSDPIGLLGDENFYRYADNPTDWIDPLGLNPFRRKNGQFGKKPGPKPKKEDTGHGNSKDNPKCTTLYKLRNPDGSLSKWGITSESNPTARYSATELRKH